MCRIALFGGVGHFGRLKAALSHLEISQGGHGNGYWSSESEKILKGVRLPTDLIAALSYNEPGVHLFHTRVATAGGVVDRLCHPFPCSDDEDKPESRVLVHNGVWPDWVLYPEYKGDSDTEVVSNMVKAHGPGVLLNDAFLGAGMFVVASRDQTVLIPRQANKFVTGRVPGGGWFHASEACQALGCESWRLVDPHAAYAVDPGTGELRQTRLEEVDLEDRGADRRLRYGFWRYEMSGWGPGPGIGEGVWTPAARDEDLYGICDCGNIEEILWWEDGQDFVCSDCWFTYTGELKEGFDARFGEDDGRADTAAGIGPYKGSALGLVKAGDALDVAALEERGVDPSAYGLPEVEEMIGRPLTESEERHQAELEAGEEGDTA